MKGYKLNADAYEKVLEKERNNMDVNEIKDFEEKIKLYNTLADFSEEDKFRAFDSSMFNSILKGYATKAMDSFIENGSDEEKQAAEILRTKIQGKIEALLDTVSAKDAEHYYMDH